MRRNRHPPTKPTSSSSAADRAARRSPGGSPRTAAPRVALIEAGGTNTSWRTTMPGAMPFQTPKTDWKYETVPQAGLNGRRGYQPRGRGLGGSSAINAMLYVRGNAWDYDNWAAMGCDGWAYDDVLPYFARAEHNVRGGDAWHGADGPLWVSDQAHAQPRQPRLRRGGGGAADARATTTSTARDRTGSDCIQVTQQRRRALDRRHAPIWTSAAEPER